MAHLGRKPDLNGCSTCRWPNSDIIVCSRHTAKTNWCEVDVVQQAPSEYIRGNDFLGVLKRPQNRPKGAISQARRAVAKKSEAKWTIPIPVGSPKKGLFSRR